VASSAASSAAPDRESFEPFARWATQPGATRAAEPDQGRDRTGWPERFTWLAGSLTLCDVEVKPKAAALATGRKPCILHALTG